MIVIDGFEVIEDCDLLTADGDYYPDSRYFDGEYTADTREAYSDPDKAIANGILWRDSMTGLLYTTGKTEFLNIHGETFSLKSAEIINKLLQDMEDAYKELRAKWKVTK